MQPSARCCNTVCSRSVSRSDLVTATMRLRGLRSMRLSLSIRQVHAIVWCTRGDDAAALWTENTHARDESDGSHAIRGRSDSILMRGCHWDTHCTGWRDNAPFERRSKRGDCRRCRRLLRFEFNRHVARLSEGVQLIAWPGRLGAPRLGRPLEACRGLGRVLGVILERLWAY